MTKEKIIPLLVETKKKAQLQDICDDLKIEYKGNDNMQVLAERIADHAEFVNHIVFKEISEFDAVPGTKKGEDGSELAKAQTEDELKAELMQECIEREITLEGEETIEELKALIDKDDADKINLAEIHSLQEQARQYKVELTGKETKEELQDKVNNAIVDAQSKEAEAKAQANARENQKKAALDSVKNSEVSLEYMNDLADLLIAAATKYKLQMDAVKKSSDRFHSAVTTLERMKREVFVK